MRALAAGLVAALALGSGAASAQTVLYKLIARDGKITYADHAPKNFDGQVIRIEPDTESNVLPSGAAAAKSAPAPATSYGAARVANREALALALRQAQDKLEAARKAKADGAEPGADEMQVIQRRFAPLKAGQQAPQSNCRDAVDVNGRAYLLCANQVPGEAFYERQKKLDEAIEKAQEDLTLAERAYRRGAD